MAVISISPDGIVTLNLSALARRPCPICGCREQPDSVDDRRYAANYHYAWDGQGFIFVGESEG